MFYGEGRWFSGEAAAPGLGEQVQLSALPEAACVAWAGLLLCPPLALTLRRGAGCCGDVAGTLGPVGHLAPLLQR